MHQAVNETLRLNIITARGPRSLRDVAASAGIDFGTLSRIESGRHSPKACTVAALARALNVPIADLFQEPTP